MLRCLGVTLVLTTGLGCGPRAFLCTSDEDCVAEQVCHAARGECGTPCGAAHPCAPAELCLARHCAAERTVASSSSSLSSSRGPQPSSGRLPSSRGSTSTGQRSSSSTSGPAVSSSGPATPSSSTSSAPSAGGSSSLGPRSSSRRCTPVSVFPFPDEDTELVAEGTQEGINCDATVTHAGGMWANAGYVPGSALPPSVALVRFKLGQALVPGTTVAEATLDVVRTLTCGGDCGGAYSPGAVEVYPVVADWDVQAQWCRKRAGAFWHVPGAGGDERGALAGSAALPTTPPGNVTVVLNPSTLTEAWDRGLWAGRDTLSFVLVGAAGGRLVFDTRDVQEPSRQPHLTMRVCPP